MKASGSLFFVVAIAATMVAPFAKADEPTFERKAMVARYYDEELKQSRFKLDVDYRPVGSQEPWRWRNPNVSELIALEKSPNTPAAVKAALWEILNEGTPVNERKPSAELLAGQQRRVGEAVTAFIRKHHRAPNENEMPRFEISFSTEDKLNVVAKGLNEGPFNLSPRVKFPSAAEVVRSLREKDRVFISIPKLQAALDAAGKKLTGEAAKDVEMQRLYIALSVLEADGRLNVTESATVEKAREKAFVDPNSNGVGDGDVLLVFKDGDTKRMPYNSNHLYEMTLQDWLYGHGNHEGFYTQLGSRVSNGGLGPRGGTHSGR